MDKTIQITKEVYHKQSTGIEDLLNRDFKEFGKSPIKKDLKLFFKIYDDIFYELPKMGVEGSHSYLLERSKSYINNYIDPKDDIIDSLVVEIENLQNTMSERLNTQEHPFFRNGSFISQHIYESGTFIMENGKRRNIQGWDLVRTLMRTQGINENFEDQILIVQPATLSGIPRGKEISTEQDLNDNIFELPLKLTKFIDLRQSIEGMRLRESDIEVLRVILDKKEPANFNNIQEMIGISNK